MIRKALGLTFMVGVVSMFAFACGDDDAPGDKYPSVDSFCSAKATLECAATTVATCGVTNDTCKAKRIEACKAEAVAATGRTYTPSKAEACLNLVSGIYSTPNDKPKYTAYLDTCQRVFSGSVAKGAKCTNKYDCTGDFICDLEKATPLCATKSAAIAKDSGCANSGDVCADGLYCAIENPPLCRARRNVSEICGATAPCIETAFCDAGGICQNLLAVGGVCNADTQCASSFCRKDATGASGACAGRLFPTTTASCTDFGG